MKPDADLASASTEGRDMTAGGETPLTERLREIAAKTKYRHSEADQLMCEAADEIDRLTALGQASQKTSLKADKQIAAYPHLQPATALPWRAKEGESAVRIGHYLVDATNAALWDNGGHDGGVCRHEDAEYMAHACNAYPHLITIARKTALGSGALADHARALLKELGED